MANHIILTERLASSATLSLEAKMYVSYEEMDIRSMLLGFKAHIAL